MGEGPTHTRIAYTRSGVDVEAGERAVELMREAVASTRRPEVIGDLGGFGGAIAIPAGYRNPVIVSSTDGVGTKTAIATALKRWDTIGVDLVAMCADDVVCSGAEPLAFLDYVAVGRLEPDAVAGLVGGVAAGCREAGCALVGGETAEHPGLMEAGTFDLAGTCLGIVERDDILDGTAARAGDLIFGLPSSGLHANGYSLVRSLLAEFAIPLDRPYQAQLSMTLGDAERDAALAAEPEHALASVGDVLLAPTRIYARRLLEARRALRAAGHDLHGIAHVTGGGLPGNVPRALPKDLGARMDPTRWPMPSVMRLVAALGGLEDGEVRATFNGGLGMIVVVDPSAAGPLTAALPDAILAGEVVPAAALGGRYVEGPLGLPVSGRVAVGVSGAGSNLRALFAAAGRGELGGEIGLVFADRDCPALRWAAEQGIDTALLPGLGAGDAGDRSEADGVLAATLAAAAINVVVLAGYMRIVGPVVLEAFPGRILNTHPSLLPAFPGSHAVRDALGHGVRVTGCTVHLVDTTLDGGPIVLQDAVSIAPGDDETTLHDRIRAVEHRLLPRAVALVLAGSGVIAVDGRKVAIDADAADRALPTPRRALLSVSDKAGLAALGDGLVRHGFELVSTGGTARTLREAGLPVTDVSAVTGFAEVLDGRVKTLHPSIHAGVLADRRRPEHRAALQQAAIAPFELVVVNLYPFAAAAEREGITFDELIEEIDIGGPSLIRAAAKNHASVAVVTSPARYESILAALGAPGGISLGLRSALAVEAFRHTAAYDARIAAELPCRLDAAGVELPREPGLPRSEDPFPPVLVLPFEKVETLRYGENPHQPAARYRRTDRSPRAADGPFTTAAPPLQGKALSYNNVLDAGAAASIARLLRGPACVIVKHTNPCGAAERPTLPEAWTAALAGDPEAAFGGVVALTGPVSAELATGLTSLFLEVVVAPAFEPAALEILATKPNLRLVVDPSLTGTHATSGAEAGLRVDYLGSVRSAGGAILVGAPDTGADDPSEWITLTSRAPTGREAADLDLAWRLVRGVVSNAIVLVRDGQLVGLGSGQVSRVDACRQAVEKAERLHAPAGARDAVAASDAFFPFADGPELLMGAGVTAIVQPGGSLRDAEVLAAAESRGAAMLVTARRHFRH